MRRRRILISLVVGVALAGPARAQESFEQYRDRMASEFDAWTQEVSDQYAAFAARQDSAYAAFKASVEAKWSVYRESTREDWVEYSPDRDARTSVNFESGQATVEVLLAASGTSGDSTLARQALVRAIERLVVDRGTTMDYDVGEVHAAPLQERPVLEGQLVDDAGALVTAENAPVFAERQVAERPVVESVYRSRDGRERVQASVVLPLVPTHIRVRAERFVEPVQRFAERNGLDPRLIFAVIHTESYFNPKARSPIPAYGLMQLVPASGARDAYLHVHGEDKLLLPNYLYEPVNNIELGCGYLDLLMTREFRRIADIRSRMYCAICAYNTGAGNVSRAFVGRNSLSAAVDRINEMTSEQVLLCLKADLPYQETRLYVGKVLERVELYNEWKK